MVIMMMVTMVMTANGNVNHVDQVNNSGDEYII